MSNPTVSVVTLAKLFNLTERRVQQLAKDDIIPRAQKGKYDLISAIQSYIKYLQDRAIGKNVEPQGTHLERARLLKAQADKTELEVKAMNGELLALKEVEILWSGLVTTFRNRMLALPVRCTHLIMTFKTYAEIEECIRQHVYEALTELSKYEPENCSIDTEESSLPCSAAAKT